MSNQQQIQPFVQQPPPVNSVSVQQIVQPLIQALGIIAQTQQQILSQLQNGVVSATEVVTSIREFPVNGRRVEEYVWFYNYGLYYNIDRTRKRITVTATDIEEHQRFLRFFWDHYVDGKV